MNTFLPDIKSGTQLVQLQGNQNKSLPVSNATRNHKGGVPTETFAKCKLKSK